MQNTKPLEFHGTAGGYFLLAIVSIIFMYIPFFGWAFLLNYASGWFADSTMVNGRKVRYQASYGESLKFVFVNALLILITLGIYSFWFAPKMYRYMVEHVDYLDESATATAMPSPTPETPAMPANG